MPQPSSRPRPFATWVRGPEWATHGYRQAGWLLLPLRAFLGLTFTFAGLQKLANPDFLHASSPTSVQHQMSVLAHSSPIGPLVNLSLHAGFVTGLVIAVAELAVGIGTLLGLRARLAATGGALLALTFFLTVSWNTTPYYYGADIVFLFAWTPFLLTGAAGVLSVDAWLAERAGPSVAMTRGSDRRRVPSRELATQRERRAIVIAGVGTLLLGGVAALAGRLAGGSQVAAGAGSLTPTKAKARKPTTPSGPTHPTTSKTSKVPPSGTKIGSTGAVPVGQAAQFTDPASGNPAWMVCLAKDHFAAFSAVCTHAGCTVQYQASSTEFICPCHGGVFSARNGQVLGGPPPSPLSSIPVRASNGQLYVD